VWNVAYRQNARNASTLFSFLFCFFLFSLWFGRAYQIFERMTSFFFTFFSVDHIVFRETDPLFAKRAKVETRCPQRVGKANAALPPKFDI
jgi:hypothetical protein